MATDPTFPIPTGKAGDPGFYATTEYEMLTQTRAIGHQTVSFRGLLDSSGNITGVPGNYIGSGVPALVADKLGTRTWEPGFKVELGYKFDTGTRIYFNYMQVYDAHYSSGATLVPPFFRTRADLSDTFLVAQVYNFPPAFGGAQFNTAADTQANGGFSSVTDKSSR